MLRLVILSVGLCLVCVACQEPAARLNAPPHGIPERTSDLQGTFVYMADNALLANMTVSDIHFYPHRGALSPLGEERLSRLASLIEVHGGTIRLSTDVTDEDLIEKRTETVMTFLAEAGVDTTREVLVEDLPGGAGMDATEVILIKVNEGTYDPNRKRSPGK